jgi:hypothetical protein
MGWPPGIASPQTEATGKFESNYSFKTIGPAILFTYTALPVI